MLRLVTLIAAVGCVLIVSAAHADSFFLGLGDLPDGGFASRAWGVSGDGMTVAGRGWGETTTLCLVFFLVNLDGFFDVHDNKSGYELNHPKCNRSRDTPYK